MLTRCSAGFNVSRRLFKLSWCLLVISIVKVGASSFNRKIKCRDSLATFNDLEVTCSNLTEEESEDLLEGLPNSTMELIIQDSPIEVFPWRLLLSIPRLTKLVINNALLTNLSKEDLTVLGNLTRLSEVHLKNNRIEVLAPFTFEALHSVETLDLRNNSIRRLEGHVFYGMTEVHTIQLSNNRIGEIAPSAFTGVTSSLRSLELGGNQLTTDVANTLLANIRIVKGFRLNYLMLNNNFLRTIPDIEMPGFTKMVIHLENNTISTIDHSLKEVITTLFQGDSMPMYLGNNPFHCNCELEWLLTLYQRYSSKPYLVPTCHSPPVLMNVKMNLVNVSLLRCGCPANNLNSDCLTKCPPGAVNVRGVCTCLPGFTRKTVANNSEATPCGCLLQYDKDFCTECPVNHFKDIAGNEPCSRCPENAISNMASTNVTQCRCLGGEELEQWSRNMSELTCVVTTPHSNVRLVGAMIGGLLVFGVIFLCALVVFMYWMKSRHVCQRLFEDAKTKSKRIQRDNVFYEGFSQRLLTVNGIFCESPGNDIELCVSDMEYHHSAVNWELPRESLKVGQRIGEGAFGLVYEGWAQSRDTSEPVKVAVKTVRENGTKEELLSLKLEMEQLIYVGRHPNIITLLGACTNGGCFMMVLEYAKHGNLLNYLRNKDLIAGRSDHSYPMLMDNKDLMSFTWQIAKGMGHLESMKCLHRDLAARNILICDNMVAKLCDFGLSRDAYESGYYKKRSQERVPFKWMSIESLLNGKYTSKSDVWSYGVVLWEIATLGGSPYPAISAKSLLDVLKSGYRMPKPDQCDDDMYKIMMSCWREKPEDRPTFGELCEEVDQLIQNNTNQHYLEFQCANRTSPAVKGKLNRHA